jgi:hypothetical protein
VFASLANDYSPSIQAQPVFCALLALEIGSSVEQRPDVLESTLSTWDDHVAELRGAFESLLRIYAARPDLPLKLL